MKVEQEIHFFGVDFKKWNLIIFGVLSTDWKCSKTLLRNLRDCLKLKSSKLLEKIPPKIWQIVYSTIGSVRLIPQHGEDILVRIWTIQMCLIPAFISPNISRVFDHLGQKSFWDGSVQFQVMNRTLSMISNDLNARMAIPDSQQYPWKLCFSISSAFLLRCLSHVEPSRA